MAVVDSTETHETERAVAAQLNPFIGYLSGRDTFMAVREGIEFLSLAALSTGEGGNDLTADGMRSTLRAMSAALRFELEADSKGGAL